MKIEHVAMYVNDIEKTRDFFVKYFNAVADCQTADCGRRQPQIIFCENAYPTALFLW